MAGWLEGVIAAFNYPEEMGEHAEDALVELAELRETAPDAHHRALLTMLERETALGLEGKSGYARARATRTTPPDIELLHGETKVWVPRADLERHRHPAKEASPPAAGQPAAGQPAAAQPAAGQPAAAQWDAFAAKDSPSTSQTIDRRFEASTKRRLVVLVGEILDEGNVALGESIARRVLAEGCQFPVQFWSLLGRALLLRGDVAGAEEPVARALLHVRSYDPTPLVLFFDFMEKRGDPDACRAIVDGGSAYCSQLKDRVKRPAGEKTPRAKERFAVLYRDAIGKVWTHARDFHQNDLYEFRGTFSALGKKVFKKHLEEIAAILPAPAKLR